MDAACELPDEAAVCRFVRALQSGDLSTLSEAERVIAAGIEGFPNDVWVLDGCDLIGDVTVYCQIQFTSAEPNSERAAAAFSVGPVNGTYDNGAINTAPGEELRYEVNEYIGLGLDPINGK